MMMSAVDAAGLRECHARVQATAGRLRLPLRQKNWRGPQGNWAGSGLGSSIDFQDHRPYLPGDDPRYIDWQAYARTGHYTMKLYREEVSPLVDLAVDLSGSMFLNENKASRTWELAYFAAESALEIGASLRCFLLRGDRAEMWPVEQMLGHALPDFEGAGAGAATAAPALGTVPWRAHSLRVVISDLLFEAEPATLLPALAGRNARAVIFAPWSVAEADPDWEGNMEFVDCETEAERPQRVEPELRARYRESYARHFEWWGATAARYGVLVARVAVEEPWPAAMENGPLPLGAVEVQG